MFVVRTAGQAIDTAVLGSIEFAVSVLNVPLIVVLGHDSCGAIKAALGAIEEDPSRAVSCATWWSGSRRRS